jgi:hypothetical protein
MSEERGCARGTVRGTDLQEIGSVSYQADQGFQRRER